jgi:hypothetical protein
MFAVFAIWAAFGFAFPSQPLPLALNVISKILSFVAATMLFAWRTTKPLELVQDRDGSTSGIGTERKSRDVCCESRYLGTSGREADLV